MNETGIEWTDLSINPIRARPLGQYAGDGIIGGLRHGHFCQKISSGCLNCYASTLQRRFLMPGFPGTNKSADDMGLEVYLDEAVLQSVLKRRKPARVFWCDMSDMFGDWVPFEWIDKCFAVMALTPHLTHQILTKRPERMAEYVADGRNMEVGHSVLAMPVSPDDLSMAAERIYCGETWPLPNVWLGTSCENQETADERIPHLLKCPAAVRFVSAEPLLGPIDLGCPERDDEGKVFHWHSAKCEGGCDFDCNGGANNQKGGIDWVIVGGESGGGARPCNVEWIRSIIEQCREAKVPCFVKQLGSNSACSYGERGKLLGISIKGFRPDQLECRDQTPLKSRKGGDMKEWPEDLWVRQFPEPEGVTP